MTIIQSTFKRITFLLVAAVIFSSAVPHHNVAINFSGDWKLNEQKSDLGEFGGRFAARKLKVNSTADSLSYERTATTQSGEEIVLKESIRFDGKESENTLFGNSKKKSTAKWADDGQSLSINSTLFFNRDGEVTEIKINETWKLADNGNSLIIESNSSSSFGENSMKLLYEKVK
jgi:hypothetical protein